MAPVPYAVYRPPPPRPVQPERPWWRSFGGWVSAAAWVVIAAVVMGGALLFYRGAVEADRRGKEEAEVAVQKEHLLAVNAWVRDTAAKSPAPLSGPVPNSGRAKQMWVIGRMLVDRAKWEREVLARHGLRGRTTPAAWNAKGYQANARDYPDVDRHLEGRIAANAEIQKTSAGWMNERTAALAGESGLALSELRDLFPDDFADVPVEEVRWAEAMLQVHRYLERIDPRVKPAEGDLLSYQRKEDIHRVDELVAKMREANRFANHAQQRKAARETAAFARFVR